MIQKINNNRLLFALVLSSFSGILLLALRVIWSGNLTFIFLPGNLLLACVPLLFAILLSKSEPRLNLKIVLLLISWLLFFPNAPYVITDLVHLRPRAGCPLWFDIVLLTSFAWNSLVLGFVSLIHIQEFLQQKFNASATWVLVTSLLVLSSFGIYLGRFQRWNSWDVVARPLSLFSDILDKIIHPMSEPRAIGMTLVFSIFLLSSYLTFYLLVKPGIRFIKH